MQRKHRSDTLLQNMSSLRQEVYGVSLYIYSTVVVDECRFFEDTVGSCSMLPREKNGVVSPDLVVYGTKNLRVVDISVIPLHFAAHSQGAL
jgi:hypothetical protein